LTASNAGLNNTYSSGAGGPNSGEDSATKKKKAGFLQKLNNMGQKMFTGK